MKNSSAKIITLPNTTAESIDATEHEAAYDASCKELLSQKYILASIMKAVTVEYAHCTLEEIAEQLIEGPIAKDKVAVMPKIKGSNSENTILGEGTVRFDVYYTALAPNKDKRVVICFNLEAQNKLPSYSLVKRVIFYLCRAISKQ